MQHDLDPNEVIRMAAEWLSTTDRHQIEGALVPALRQRFPLTPMQACDAIRQADLLKRGRVM